MLGSLVPTVLRLDGMRVVIYPNDHEPMHVHVIGDGCEALFSIAGPGVVLLENYGFADRTVRRIKADLADHRAQLVDDWRRIHG